MTLIGMPCPTAGDAQHRRRTMVETASGESRLQAEKWFMRVLAARFPERHRASAVLSRLGHALAIYPPDVAIAPLGDPGSGTAGETLLAGRFPDERLPEVVRFVHDGGGEVLANVDERWTVPAASAGTPRH